ncbi:MAG: class I SAM-dependent methyltransferase [Rhodobacteraceae bacterium]|nr:class I SAM-dependent methyltransferase [Paracoccaceae bacterium]
MARHPSDEEIRKLHDVYASSSLDEAAGIYDSWADDYEDHMGGVGYSHPAMVAAMLARHQPAGSAPILDAGAGTGIMAGILGAMGYPTIYGFDISQGMLGLAMAKGFYKDLRTGCLGEPLDYQTDQFAACIASGVFTQGHAPLDGLDELVRVTRPGGHIVFSVARSYLGEVFETKASALERGGKWRRVDATEHYDSTPLSEDTLIAQVYAYSKDLCVMG